MSSSRPLALVTGASMGIGVDLATVLAERGHDLILVARSAEKLQAVADRLSKAHGVTAHVLVADLAGSAGADAVADQVAARGWQVDVLINNAGYGLFGPLTETDAADELQMIELNVTALYRLTKRLLPGMVARRRGWIMNVASTAAFFSGPFMAVYYATKNFVLSFSEGLAEELDGTGVLVSCLCPGPTKSGFRQRAGTEHSKLTSRGQVESYPVAVAGVDGLFGGQRVVVPGLKNRVETLAPRLLPRRMITRIVRGAQEAKR
ncbi:MAG: SDR family oxidoreductase [Gemmatimonadetes bacterium]|nr:SDR family oxidoreductase [Gemmatimonadota bacterium]